MIYDLLGIPGYCGEHVIAGNIFSSSQFTGHRLSGQRSGDQSGTYVRTGLLDACDAKALISY